MATDEIRMPVDVKIEGQALFDHQCWAWGKDIARKEGNLLLEYGFEQIRPKSKGMTQYTVSLTGYPDLFLSIWGFGFYVGDKQNGVFMGRSRFTPMQASGELKLHDKADQFQFCTRSGDWPMLLKGIGEIARYEEWIANRFPHSYRTSCFEDFPRNVTPRIENALPDLWWSLKRRIEEENNGLL
jgi:hypothetical protein